MTKVVLLALALILNVTCVRNVSQSQGTESGSSNAAAPPMPNSAANFAGDSDAERKKSVPSAYRDVDFNNFDYVTTLRGRIRLKDGHYEYTHPRGLGGDTFNLSDVHYVDLTGDGKEEAIVNLNQLSCGASCDGGSHLFYFYLTKNGQPREFWRLETGSLAYGCGLKSFVLAKRQITLEVFTSCHLKGRILESGPDPYAASGGKFFAASFTRFRFKFSGHRSEVENRELLPYPQNDVKGYQAVMSINQ